MIKLINLEKYYNKGSKNEYHVINNISYTFEDTGLYTFFGPSGCGKTTLLNVIGCLDKFDSGSIVFEDVEFKRYSPKTADELRNKMIGYIFQNYNLVDSKSVCQNVEVVLDMIGITDKEEKEKRITEVLKAVGLYKHRKKNVLALSGGERQRVAIARALAKNPKVILADEPTGNLDSNNTFEVMNIIKKISKDRLVILVSHEKNLVDYYADKIIELKDGVIVNEIENNKDKDFLHKDSRNIYLKDYNKIELENESVSLNIYNDDSQEKNSFDIIYRNGEIYIKSNSSSKVHLINENSEIKLIDMSEKDFISAQENKESDFSLDIFKEEDNLDTKKKPYISLFSSIKSSFKSKGYIKKNGFTRFVLLATGIFFAFLFTSLSSILMVDKDNYIKTPKGVVCVDLKYKDKKKGYDYNSIVSDASKVKGYESIVGTLSSDSYNIQIDLSRLYQTSSSYNNYTAFDIYLEKENNKEYQIVSGNKIQNDNEIVISSKVAQKIIESNQAKINGYTSELDLIGKIVSINVSYYSKDDIKIVGIMKADSSLCYVNNNTFINGSGFESDSFYISCENEEEMIKTLSEKYSSVYDARNTARKVYMKERLREKSASLIFSSIMTIALLLYLVLMIRSSMFNKVKDIGILRSIGATKKDIHSIFTGDIITLTIKTSFITYTLAYIIIAYFSREFSLSALGLKLFNANLLTYILGLFVIFFINIISSLIPVSILMAKTPVEIIKKYDI